MDQCASGDVSRQGELLAGGTIPYRILTVWQPWASCIITGTARGFKDIENRGKSSSWRGRLFIQAAKVLQVPAHMDTGELETALRAARVRLEVGNMPDWAWPVSGPDGTRLPPLALPFGAILGYVDLHACTSKWNNSPWAVRGQWHWWLRNPVALDTPIPARGYQNLWTPPAGTPEGRALAVQLEAIP
jgi:hypothetical protein